VNHEYDNLGDSDYGDAAASQNGTAHSEIIPGPMAQAGPHHADELGNALQTEGSAEAGGPSANDMACTGGSRNTGDDHGRTVATLGPSSGDAESLWSGIRSDGERCWKVDLCRLLNMAAGEKVIDDRQLRRHTSRGGHRFIDGRFVNIPRYIAWLVDEVHAPPVPKRLTNRTGTVTLHGILHVINQQRRRCALTGRPLIPEDATLDHKLPVSRGGEHSLGNIQILHRDVNRAKSTLTNTEFITLCREVVAWADHSTSN
jgi:hypothetical protein